MLHHGTSSASRPPPANEHNQDIPAEWEQEIRHHLTGKTVLLGVGNRLKGDDAAGSVVAEKLSRRGHGRAFDCGGVPENYVGKVAAMNPDHILFVDAVDFGAEPGTVALFGGEQLSPQSFSTHSAGLSPVMDFLRGACEADCWLLAIQPQRLGDSTELSEAAGQAIDRIVTSEVWLDRI